MARAVIWTGSGFLDLEAPDPNAIRLADIARALSRAPRFAGLTERPLSVAEHCLLCEDLARGFALPPRLRLWALLHDAAEAYICDLPGPLKACLPEYQRIEEGLLRAVAQRFGLMWPVPYAVWEIDRIALKIERRAVLPATRGLPEWPELPAAIPDWAPEATPGAILDCEPDTTRQRFEWTARMLMGCSDEARDV
ncbi:hypothetical protein ACSSV4_000619 [Roseovarius sp. MBR-154]|jgi:hypothetical protein